MFNIREVVTMEKNNGENGNGCMGQCWHDLLASYQGLLPIAPGIHQCCPYCIFNYPNESYLDICTQY